MASSARTPMTNNTLRSHYRPTPTRTIDLSIHRIPRKENSFLRPDPDFAIYIDADVLAAQDLAEQHTQAPIVAGPPPPAPTIAPQRDYHDQHQQHLTPLALPLPALSLPSRLFLSPPAPPSLPPSPSPSPAPHSQPHPKIRGRK
ncbi:MAG: hypothetical protein LQ348_005708, partial [Seirophora lacunosa]